MSLSKRLLEKQRAAYGRCRSQSQQGPAVLYSCILWNGHDGEHKRFDETWKSGEGYEPTPEEIAAMEAEEEMEVEEEIEDW